MRRRLTALTLVISMAGFAPSLLVAQEAAPARIQTASDGRIKKFTVTLVLGDTQAGAYDTLLAPAAAKALADLKDFLPYKKYRELDTVPIIGLNGPWVMLRAGERKYSFYMQSTDESPSLTKIDMLRLVETLEGGKTGPLLIDTSFKITAGETVVVGTSRLEGTQALILLVTAVKP